MVFHICLSLSWGASRAYFIKRSLDMADPDPSFGLVLGHVFPHMLVVTVHSLVVWCFLGGLLGPWSLAAMVANAGAVYMSLASGSNTNHLVNSQADVENGDNINLSEQQN